MGLFALTLAAALALVDQQDPGQRLTDEQRYAAACRILARSAERIPAAPTRRVWNVREVPGSIRVIQGSR
jgi:hypothetical protein